MVMSMKDNGLMIKLMVKEPICIKMEHLIWVDGLMINNMVMVSKNGWMEQFMSIIIYFTISNNY